MVQVMGVAARLHGAIRAEEREPGVALGSRARRAQTNTLLSAIRTNQSGREVARRAPPTAAVTVVVLRVPIKLKASTSEQFCTGRGQGSEREARPVRPTTTETTELGPEVDLWFPEKAGAPRENPFHGSPEREVGQMIRPMAGQVKELSGGAGQLTPVMTGEAKGDVPETNELILLTSKAEARPLGLEEKHLRHPATAPLTRREPGTARCQESRSKEGKDH